MKIKEEVAFFFPLTVPVIDELTVLTAKEKNHQSKISVLFVPQNQNCIVQ
jgi:hypothetical protein